MSEPDGVFLCGYTPGSTPMVPISQWEGLSKAERKAILNFQAYLRGKGSRCPNCLHKAAKHELRCGARDCDCDLDNATVKQLRAQVQARGWEDD